MKKQDLTKWCVALLCSAIVAGCADMSSDVPNQKAVDALSNLDDAEGEASEDAEPQEGTSKASGKTEETASKPSDDKKTLSKNKAAAKPKKAVATFGNGCYWCTESVFQEFKGIYSVVSGFSGGKSKKVTYREVCTGTTGHAEVVQVEYNPDKVSYKQLLQAFFLTHDPTTLNRQGADVGTQYRSVIFYHDKQQEALARKAIKELTAAKAFKRPIVTEIAKFEFMVPAPKYHQDYFDKNPRDRYCLFNVPSKVAKVRKVFKGLVKDKK